MVGVAAVAVVVLPGGPGVGRASTVTQLPPGVTQLPDGAQCPDGTLCFYHDYARTSTGFSVKPGYAVDLGALPCTRIDCEAGGPGMADNVSVRVNDTSYGAVLVDFDERMYRILPAQQELDEPPDTYNRSVDLVSWAFETPAAAG